MAAKSKKKRYNFLIDSTTYKQFSEICEDKGLVRSKQVELFMKGFIKKRKR